jgi:RNA polymerase sigma-70 factor (ECF subfamily)
VQQQIIEDKEYKGKTIEDIATALGMQPSAVKMQLSRARKKVREIYKQRES